MKKFLFIVTLCFASSFAHAACSVSGTTYTAASASQADVAACLTSIGSTDGVTLVVPAGSSTWTTGVTFCNTITFQGAGAGSTVITRNTNGNLFANTNNCNNKTIKFTGFSFIDLNSVNASNAQISTANCYGCTLVALNNISQGSNVNTSRFLNVSGSTYGVAANNTIQDIAGIAETYISSESGTQLGNNAWTLNPRWGTANCFYYENNTINWPNHLDQFDEQNGACVEYRYNTFTMSVGANPNVGSLGAFDHGYDSVPRSGKEIIFDHNTCAGYSYRCIWFRGGSGIVYTNKMVAGFTPLGQFELNNYRSDSGSIGQAGNNKGNYCNGAINVDGNLSGISNDGWPCRDQIGRGKDNGIPGTQGAYSLASWDNCTTTVGGCAIGGANEVDPAVVEAYSGAVQNSTIDIVKDRDYFQPVTTGSGHGVGTAGVGQGTLAQRPATCSTISNSSGPYYWATDQGSAGILYNCSATNTWSVYYTPYTYPHPLAGPTGGPIVQLAPTSLTFPSQVLGTSSTEQTVTLTNIGTASMTVNAPSFTGDYSIGPSNTCGGGGGTILAPTQSCTLSTIFTPSGVGTRNGTMSVTDTAPGSPHSVPLTGTGVSVPVVFTPPSLSFSNIAVGSTSAAQVVILTNGSASTLTITSIVTTGDFANTTSCGGTLGAGLSCNISVTFTPTNPGPRSGIVTMIDSASGSPHTIPLDGVGLPVSGNAPVFISGNVKISGQWSPQ